MSPSDTYEPGPADVARVRKDGEIWTLVLVKELHHPPERVWRALTEPAQLREWAPFDASQSLDVVGDVELVWAGTSAPVVSSVTRAVAPHMLEMESNGNLLRWEVEGHDGGTRLTLWAIIDRRFISMGAAGWHVALDVLERLLDEAPIGRIAGPTALRFDGWRRLEAAYAQQFGSPSPIDHRHEEKI